MTNFWLMKTTEARGARCVEIEPSGGWSRCPIAAPLSVAVGDGIVLWRTTSKGIEGGVVAIGTVTMSVPAVEQSLGGLARRAFAASPKVPTSADRSEPEPTFANIRISFDRLLLGKPLTEDQLRAQDLSGLVEQIRPVIRDPRSRRSTELVLTVEQRRALDLSAIQPRVQREWPLAWEITPGSVVKRSELQRVYGGAGGPIAVCARTPNILVFVKRSADLAPAWVDQVLLVPGQAADVRDELASENQVLAGHVDRGLPVRVFELRGGDCRYVGEFAVDDERPIDRVVDAGKRTIGNRVSDRFYRHSSVGSDVDREVTRDQTAPIFRLHQLDGMRMFDGEPDQFAYAPKIRLALRSAAEGAATVATEEDQLLAAYRASPERLRQLITDDDAARDIVAVAHRKRQVARFRCLLSDDAHFDDEVAKVGRNSAEAVWQQFFEENPWIFGVALSGQLLISWNNEKLEQVVAGASVSDVGKRTDALLRTSGRISSLVFAEIKTHRKVLLDKEYRSGCWAPSAELSGGVAQAQGTVHRAVSDIGERLQCSAPDGSEIPGDYTYLLQPRSYLIIGQLDEFIGRDQGHHRHKIRSFELYRRKTADPEILTFDELLARAEWSVTA